MRINIKTGRQYYKLPELQEHTDWLMTLGFEFKPTERLNGDTGLCLINDFVVKEINTIKELQIYSNGLLGLYVYSDNKTIMIVDEHL